MNYNYITSLSNGNLVQTGSVEAIQLDNSSIVLYPYTKIIL